jgi:uncharacterized protein YoaH (UPF0181 family)
VSLNIARADKSARIAVAITVIQSGEFIDYSKVVAKFEVDRTTLSKRIRSLTRSREEAISFFLEALTNEQEEVLIERINKLTNRGIPPTSSIVKILIEEIKGREVSKN